MIVEKEFPLPLSFPALGDSFLPHFRIDDPKAKIYNIGSLMANTPETRPVPLFIKDAPSVRAREAELAVSEVFMPTLLVESPRFRGTKVGKRLERAYGMASGGITRVGRVLESDRAIQASEFVDSKEIVKQLREDLKDPLDSSQLSIGSFTELVPFLRETVREVGAIDTSDEKTGAKRNVAEGLSLALRGTLQLAAFESVVKLPEARNASIESLNNAWTLTQMGASSEEVTRYLTKPNPEMAAVMESVLAKRFDADVSGMDPDCVVTASDNVSADDLKLVAEMAIPNSVLHNELAGNELAHIHISRNGFNHFSFTIDTKGPTEKANKHIVDFGLQIKGNSVVPYVNYVPEERPLIDFQTDEVLFLVRRAQERKRGSINSDSLKKTAALLAHQVAHKVAPQKNSTNERYLSSSVQDFRSYVEAVPYQYLAAHTKELWDIVWQQQQSELAVSSPAFSPRRRLPLPTQPSFSELDEAMRFARQHGGYLTTNTDRTYTVIPGGQDLPTEPRFVKQPEAPKSPVRRILSTLASIF